MSYHLTVDTIAARLHREGWSVGDIAVKRDSGWVWVVSGQHDGRWLAVEGKSQAEAWRQFSARVISCQSAGPRRHKDVSGLS
jgi:hypothetical protein